LGPCSFALLGISLNDTIVISKTRPQAESRVDARGGQDLVEADLFIGRMGGFQTAGTEYQRPCSGGMEKIAVRMRAVPF